MMPSPSINDLQLLCISFRSAITRTDRRLLSPTFHDFPHGSCGDASLVLGRFLSERGYDIPDYVNGIRARYSHAWLELGMMILDITLTQYRDDPNAFLWLDGLPNGIRSDVLVTTHRQWYEQFKDRRRHPVDLTI